ncbi:MAG: PLP-dependent transferase [Anaerolineae bacterium]|nr:PLP-dependent transferase [Anaerolineae bacterium]
MTDDLHNSDFLNSKDLFTRAVHAGERMPAPDFIPTVTPIYHATSFAYAQMDDLDAIFDGTREGYVYTRYGNPTVRAFERAIAVLEEGEAALAFGSGMGAIHAALLGLGLKAGASAVVAQDVYGATFALFSRLLFEQGVITRFVDTAKLDQVDAACAELKPRVLFVETVSNPLLKVADIPRLAAIAHAHGALLAVDNTFATPYLCRPLPLGADVVIHSATKYIGGHGDVLGGVIVAAQELIAPMYEVLKITGANLGPQDAWLLLRGLKTLPLRMERHCANALKVTNGLLGTGGITRIIYPGRPDHPQHNLATRLFGKGYGGMIAFELRNGSRERVFRFFEALKLCLPATTLGDVYTLLLYPAHSSHRALSAEQRAEFGIGEGLVRMSVGIEAPEDILADIKQALENV